MNGRFMGIKKSFFLKFMAFFIFTIFAILTFFIVYYYKIYDIWFYNFCLFLGLMLLIKSKFFRLDSSLYMSLVLVFIGISGYLFSFLNCFKFAGYFICLSFVLASIMTFIKTKQRFHLELSYSISFITIFSYILTKNLITLPIFIAFVSPFLVLLSVEIICNIKWRR